MKINSQLFIASTDAAKVFEPPDALLDDASTTIRLAVELDLRIIPGFFVVLMRDHRLDAFRLQPIADSLHAVAFVGSDFTGFVPAFSFLASASDQAGDRLADDRLGTRRFVRFSSGDFDGKRSSLAVSNKMELRSKPAPAAAQRVVGRFVGVSLEAFFSAPAAARVARTLAPSTHQSSQSIRPLESSLICNASTIAAKIPARRQLLKYRCTVWKGPKRSGRSRQGAPVARIQSVPSSMRRGSFGGRPVVAVLCGISGEMSSH